MDGWCGKRDSRSLQEVFLAEFPMSKSGSIVFLYDHSVKGFVLDPFNDVLFTNRIWNQKLELVPDL